MKIMRNHPYLKKFYYSYHISQRDNHPITNWIKENEPLIRELDTHLQLLEGNDNINPLLLEISKQTDPESVRDLLVELRFAAFLSSNNILLK